MISETSNDPIEELPGSSDLRDQNTETAEAHQADSSIGRLWTRQTEESAVAYAMVNTNLTQSQRSVFVAIAQIVCYHQGKGESRSDGFVPVTVGEIATTLGASNRKVERYLRLGEDWGLIERAVEWTQVSDINPKTGKSEFRPNIQLFIRQRGADFLQQVRLIASFDPGLGKNAGWGGRRDTDEVVRVPETVSAPR